MGEYDAGELLRGQLLIDELVVRTELQRFQSTLLSNHLYAYSCYRLIAAIYTITIISRYTKAMLSASVSAAVLG